MSTPLLNDDGRASMATMLLTSHHAFRRDLALFARTLPELAGDAPRARAVSAEWGNYRGALHGHHMMEDANIFPSVKKEHPQLANAIDRLSAEHELIDPVLIRGDAAFADLARTKNDAIAVVKELTALLSPHLEFEEATIVPQLRGAFGFPPPATEEEAALYAQGFAWSTLGIASDVLDRIFAALPEVLTSKLPAARAAFAQRCESAWSRVPEGQSKTSVPDWLVR